MGLPALLLKPDFYFTLIGLLESCALLSTSLLLFRVFTIAISSGYVALSLWVGLASPGMTSILAGACLDIAINLFMIASFLYARSILSLQPGWRGVYRAHFATLLPFEFRRLLNLGTVIALERSEPELIVRTGDAFEKLYFVIEGLADIVLHGTAHATLRQGDWIAEFSMLTGQPASADVRGASLRMLSWDAESLRRLKGAMPEVYEKINALIARNLCDKLVRANRSANQVMAEHQA